MSTIAAISTPFGTGGIAVIRISGEEAFCVADRVFSCHTAKRLFEVPANTVVYGKVYDKEKRLIDQVLAAVFRAPHSYTGEDTVELSCHGGILIAKKVLKAVLDAGAQLADRGEFTKRAFVNGKLDLSQAEGVIDLINAVSDKGAQTAVFQMEGKLSARIKAMREQLVGLAAHLEAAADFPEEEIPELSGEQLIGVLEQVAAEAAHLLQTADYGRILKDGLPVAVIGKPNVGKSSLLNALAGQDRAIVTDVAGTTRDVIEEYINLDGIAVRLMDTAGIRETLDQVESIGVERSRQAAEKAALILAVFDGSQPLDEQDRDILSFVKGKPHLVVLNKADQGRRAGLEGILISAKSGEGLEALIRAIGEQAQSGAAGESENIITNERHYACLLACQKSLEQAKASFRIGMPLDMITIDVQESISALGEIVGMTVSEEIVDQIFHNFCLGK